MLLLAVWGTSAPGKVGNLSLPVHRPFMVDEDIISSLEEPVESFNISGIYPNPFDNVTNINLSIQQDQHIRIDVLDINGKLVATIADKPFTMGDYQLQWDGSRYPAGIYHVTVKGDQLIGTAKLIKR